MASNGFDIDFGQHLQRGGRKKNKTQKREKSYELKLYIFNIIQFIHTFVVVQELLLEQAELFYHVKSIAPTGTITQEDIRDITHTLQEDSR